jgi:hypothetical protein
MEAVVGASVNFEELIVQSPDMPRSDRRRDCIKSNARA